VRGITSRRNGRSRGLAAACACAAVAIPVAGDAQGAVRWHHCGSPTVRINEYNTTAAYRLKARRVSCVRARRVARKAIRSASESSGPYLGFRCAANSRRVLCTRSGGRRVSWLKNPPAGGADARGRASSSPAVAARRRIVLGSKSFAPNGSGWGTSRPSSIFNGGDPSGYVDRIHWSRWGGHVARGHGRNAIFRPNGGYYSRRVRIKLRASHLGRCHKGGPRAYRRLSFRAPSRPGGPLGPWTLWSGKHTLCHW
jgi:hypothetical protein